MINAVSWLPDEYGVAMKAIMAAYTGSTEELAAYAQWLSERGDERRAEILRTEMALLADPDGPDAPALARLLDTLLVGVDPYWWEVIRRGTAVHNCGRSEDHGAVRFEVMCPRTWESLDPTAEDGARMCRACDSLVYWCDTVEQAEKRARLGQCITIDARLTQQVWTEVTRMVTGRPQLRPRWAQRIFRS